LRFAKTDLLKVFAMASDALQMTYSHCCNFSQQRWKMVMSCLESFGVSWVIQMTDSLEKCNIVTVQLLLL